ncbi:DUF3943 domain-containing protein, partial [Parapusillimonas sp. SGNA-6]|nr:DUF3943 domain-containing protein [Parapusillimonas sp. SGNA-6]
MASRYWCIVFCFLLGLFFVHVCQAHSLPDSTVAQGGVTGRVLCLPNSIAIDSSAFRSLQVDSLNPKREKKFWRAGTEWFLAQAFPATFNRFITKDPYSYITFKNFLDHQRISAWDWDDNQFTTNQFDHPYHGQLYFNAFRSNGYNFYQS